MGNGDPTQDTSCIGTARVKQEEEADTRVIANYSSKKSEERNVGTKDKSPKQGLTSATHRYSQMIIKIMHTYMYIYI